MKQSKKLVPQLRFPEFDNQLQEKKLENLLSFKNGINASKEDYGSGYRFINVLDIIDNTYITHDKIKGEVNISEEIFNKNIVEYGDILFQRSSETREEVGQSNVYLDKDIKATFGGFVIRGKKIAEYDPFYFNSLLKSSTARKEITSKAGGSTRYNVGQDILSSVKLRFPTLAEQQKIASFLTQVDKKIDLLSHKLDHLELYKKGVMQKLFNQEVRFKRGLSVVEGQDGGSDYPDWEEKRLSEISSVNKGKQLNRSELFDDGHYPSISGGIEPSGYTDKWNTEKNTIIISEGGNSCGYVNYIETKFWCGGHCYALKVKNENVEKTFLYQSLKFNQNQIMRLRVGSGLPNIQKKDLSKFKLNLPCKEEQTKIANYLSAIDLKISFTQQQLEQTQMFKKGLLQKMFV